MALTPSWPGPTGLATTTDARKNLAGLIETDTAGNVRSGVFPAHANPLVTARADMNVDIAVFQGVAVQFGGPVLISNDGVAQLPSALVSPGSGTNYYVIYAKQNESTSPGTDANNNRVFGAALSTASFAAARALLPAGALELATVQMPTGKTATNNAGVTVTQTFQYTAAEGGVVWARNATELGAWTPPDGALAWQIDTLTLMIRAGGVWTTVGERSAEIAGSASGALPVASGWIDLGGSVTIPANPFGANVPYEIEAVAVSTATILSGGGYGVRIRQGANAFSFGGVAQMFPAAGQSVFSCTGKHVVSAPASAVVVKAQIAALNAQATVDSSNANLSGLMVTIRPRAAI